MSTITLKRIHEDILDMRKEMEKLRMIVTEKFELSPDLVADIKASRKSNKLISQKDMRREFG